MDNPKIVKCPTCGGLGKMRWEALWLYGEDENPWKRLCPTCSGHGRVVGVPNNRPDDAPDSTAPTVEDAVEALRWAHDTMSIEAAYEAVRQLRAEREATDEPV